jgi:mitogen-activated protein kinase kinase kinase 3
MPAWWKGKRRSKSKGAAAETSIPSAVGGVEEKGAGKKKASSFDDSVLAKGGRGKQLQQQNAAEVIGHPLPRPASVSAQSASASASSGGSSSLGSSAASDEPPDLEAYR